MAKSRVAPEIRAAALADLQAGEMPAVVADRYGLDREVVKKWKTRYVPAHVPDVGAVPVPPSRPVLLQRPALERAQLGIAELVMKNLEAKLLATQRIAEYAANSPAWLDKQTAADVGELFERIDRSAIAILDRMATAGRGTTPGDNEDPRGFDP